MVNVHIITQNEPFFIPKMIRYLIENQKDSYTIESFTVLKPHRKNKSLIHWFSERAKIYKIHELFIAIIAYVYTKSYGILSFLPNHYSAKKILERHSVHEVSTADINSKEYINSLNKIGPDVIISISCPQIFKKELLSVPTKSCINAHGTLLPRHRGVFGTWWTLFCNDELAGGTIHTMEEDLDRGEIVWQETFNVEASDTQYSLAHKTKKMMARGLTEVLGKYYSGGIEFQEPEFKESYHRAPSKELGKKFHQNGHKVIVPKNIFDMLATKF